MTKNIIVVTSDQSHPTFGSLSQGEMFRYQNGTVVYMKADGQAAFHLGTGQLYTNPTLHNLVERVAEITIRTDRS